MKFKKKSVIITIVLLATLILLCIPMKTQFNDGGTVVYSALAYKVIVWHAIIAEGQFKSGTEFYVFPNNFHEYDYYFNQ